MDFYLFKKTVVAELPSTWEALIELDNLSPGFEVGHHGGVSHFICQTKGNSANYPWNTSPPPLLPGISLHNSTTLSLAVTSPNNQTFWLKLSFGTQCTFPFTPCISAPSPLSPSQSCCT